MSVLTKIKKIAFLKDSSIYVFGEIISKITPFLLLPYVARKMGVENYGELSYYQTYIGIFSIFLLLSQDGSVARYFYFYGKNSLNLVVITGYSYTIILGIIMLMVFLVYEQELLAYAVITAVFSSFISVQLSLRQCQKKTQEYISIQFVSSIISIIATIFVLETFTIDIIKYRILGGLITNIIVFFIIYFLFTQNTNIKKFSFKQYKLTLMYILGFGSPLILHHLSGFLRGQVDRIFIYTQFGKTDLGLYSMATSITSVILILIMAINKAIIPYYYESLKNKTISFKEIKKWFWISLTTLPIPSLIVNFVPESFFVLVLGNDFFGIKYYIIILLFSTTLIIPYLVLVNYLFYYGKNKHIALCSIITTIFYLLILFFLIFYIQQIKYIPYANIFSSLIILPILWFMIKKLDKKGDLL